MQIFCVSFRGEPGIGSVIKGQDKQNYSTGSGCSGRMDN